MRDTRMDTEHVWFDTERGYIFRDTEEAPEGPFVGLLGTVSVVPSEDLDPIQTAIEWLRFAVKNHGVISPHDFEHLRKTVIPEAEKQYRELVRVASQFDE
jgi:hypothetical protein